MSVSETSLLEVDLENDDHHVVLLDGSNWFVNPRDLPTIARWVPAEEIIVECCVDNTLFPYKLTNKEQDVTVLAMKIS